MKGISIVPERNPETITKLNRELHDLHAKLFPKEFKPWNYDALLPAFQQMLDRDDVSCYLLKVGEENAGYILGWPIQREENGFQFSKRIWYVDHICVLEKFRGKGLSKILLEKAEEIAQQENCTELEIHHWTSNDTASKSFQAFGFNSAQQKMRKLIVG